MSEAKVLLERHGTVAHLVLNRPQKLNAIDGDCLRLLRAHIATIEVDAAIRAVVIRGAGRAFCAGADLDYVGPIFTDPRGYGAFLAEWHQTFDGIADCSRPTIAAVHGLALAGGFELTLACDFVVMAGDAHMGDQHANFGLIAGGGATQRLPRLIGVRQAKWLLLSGDRVDAARALQLGLANAIVPPGELLTRAEEMAAVLSAKSPLANAHAKEAVRLGLAADLHTGLAIERRIGVQHMQSEDVQIGLQAFHTRTQPQFKGR